MLEDLETRNQIEIAIGPSGVVEHIPRPRIKAGLDKQLRKQTSSTTVIEQAPRADAMRDIRAELGISSWPRIDSLRVHRSVFGVVDALFPLPWRPVIELRGEQEAAVRTAVIPDRDAGKRE